MDLGILGLGLFTLFAVMYHIGHREYDKRYPQKEKDNELTKLSSKVYQMDQQIQSQLLELRHWSFAMRIKSV